MPKSLKCACGIRSKVHGRKSRRGQLPDLKTNRWGRPQPRPNKKREQ